MNDINDLGNKLSDIEEFYKAHPFYHSLAITKIIDIYLAKIYKLSSKNITVRSLNNDLHTTNIKDAAHIYELLSRNFVRLYSNFDLVPSEKETLNNLLDISTDAQGIIPLAYEKGANRKEYEAQVEAKGMGYIPLSDPDKKIEQNKVEFTKRERDILEDHNKRINTVSDDIKKNTDFIKDNTSKIEDNTDLIKDSASKIENNTDLIKDSASKIEDNKASIRNHIINHENSFKTSFQIANYTNDQRIKLLEKIIENNSPLDNQDFSWVQRKISEIEEAAKEAKQIKGLLTAVSKEKLYAKQSEAFESFEKKYDDTNMNYKVLLVSSLIIYAVYAFAVMGKLPSIADANIEFFDKPDLLYLLKWSLPSIIITTLLFQFLGLMKKEMMTAQVMMEAYRHKTSMIMSSIGFKDYFEQSPDSEKLILSEMIKALAHNPTDDLKQMQKVKQDMPIDKAFGVIDKGLDKIVTIKEKIDKSFGKKPDAPRNENTPPQS